MIEDLNQLLTNDTLFWMIQTALSFAVVWSVYIQFIQQPTSIKATKLKGIVSRSYRKVHRVILRKLRNTYQSFKYFAPLDKRTNNVVISPDSAVLALSSSQAKLSIHRNESSWQYFGLAWTVISVLFIEINSTYYPLQDSEYSIIVTLLNLGSITWLCFYSSWFRNCIIRIINHRNIMPD